MTDIEFDITADMRPFIDIDEKLKNALKPLEEIGMLMRRSVGDNFIDQGRPEKWPERRHQYPHPMLMKTLNLFESFDYEINNDEVTLFSDVSYGQYHHPYTDSEPRDPNAAIDKRPFMMLQEQDEADIETIIANHLIPS